ncbi:leukemia-associated protein 7 homolog [Oncorhynchus mykiss]|uniref:Deleted in lymphocytic leukemia 7 n=1 Tax=Oncorhynchus mykiss TaxID=8022 RepID=A0A8C7QNL9_ONCMY|nr:leukemia-associated protein 7 homolog [Oncorhynchus mykiss]
METATLQYSPMEHQTEALKLLQNVRSHQTAISRPSKLGLEKQVTTIHDSSAAARTIAEKARESVITQLIDILTQILTVEEEISHSLFQDLRTFLHPKESIELRNICVRMAVRDSDCQKDRDLRDLQDCLKAMVDSLVSSLINVNHPVAVQTSRTLEEIYLSFPEI